MVEYKRNPYHPCFRIGSERYNEYLTDLFTGFYYDRMVPFEDDLEKEAAYGERMWQSQTEATPDELLCTAVIGRAVVDLMELYCAGNVGDSPSVQASPEREGQTSHSFRVNPQVREIVRFLELFDDSGTVLNTLMYLLRKTRDPEWVLDYVKRRYSRFLAGIGKKNKKQEEHENGNR